MKSNKKYKLISIVLCVILVLGLLPVSAFAYTDGFSRIFDQDEYDQLKTFLNLPSASDAGYSNGRCMSFMYDENDPMNWPGVTWEAFTEGTDTVYHVTYIIWNAYDLNGDLDLSNFDQLLTFNACNNHLDSLKVQNDTKLTTLVCENTHLVDLSDDSVINEGLKSLDVSTNTALETLGCSDNALGSLDLSNNTALKTVNCSENNISLLDTSAAGTNLTSLECGGNDMSTLNISENSALMTLDCSDNQLKGTLDLTDYASLGILSCWSNSLSSLVTTGCPNLKTLSCSDNQIGSLGLSDNTELETLVCSSNSLEELNVDSNTKLTTLECAENQLNSLSVSLNTKLTWLSCEINNLTELSVGTNKDLVNLYCGGNSISELDVTGNTALQELDCGQNNISVLDVSNNTDIYLLECNDNLLTELNVGYNTLLKILNCGGNNFDSLDVTKNVLLESLGCNDSGLSALDITKNTNLYDLDCSGNQFKTLDLTNNTNLATLNCSDNQFKTLDLTNNTNLFAINCSGNQFESLDLSIFFLYAIDCRDNPLTYLKAALPYDMYKTSDIELHTNGEGYVGLYFIWDDYIEDNMFIEATPKNAGAPVNWTNAKNIEISTLAKYALEYNTEYNLTANFAYVVSFDSDGGSAVSSQNVFPGKKAVKPAEPSKAGFVFGGWHKEKSLATAWNFDTDTVSANTTLFAKWVKSPAQPPAVIAVGLSCTKTDVTKYGTADGSITVNASGGNSGLYEYSIDGGTSWQKANIFSDLAAGPYTAVVRDAGDTANTATCAVTIGQPTYIGNVAAKKLPSKANAGTALTIVPPVATRGYTLVSVTYSSSNPSVASVDSNGNVTFLAGGKAKITTKFVYQKIDSKGKVRTKTIISTKRITVKELVATVALSLSSTTIERKQKVKLTAAIAPITASSKRIKWTSSNPKVASVSSSGVVTGKAAGTAVITCTARDGSGISASCTVTVTPIDPTGAKMSKTVMTLKTGKSASLRARVLPRTTDFKTVTWASSNPAIATVDAKGKVKGVAPGTAVITATTSNGFTVSCTVTVK